MDDCGDLASAGVGSEEERDLDPPLCFVGFGHGRHLHTSLVHQ